jgi:hypothetical protein
MRRIASIILIVGLLWAGVSFADIKYTSDILVAKGPSITALDGNFYVAYADKDKDVLFGKVKIQTAGGTVVIWQKSAEVQYSTNHEPCCGSVDGKLVLGFVEENNNAKLVTYDTDFNMLGTTEYKPSAEYALSVASFRSKVVNTWASSDKPGLTLVGSDITSIGSYNNLCDLRYSEYKPKSPISLDVYGDLAAAVWKDGDDKIHITCFALQLSGGAISVSGYHDTLLAEKTKLYPACAFNEEGTLVLVWPSEDTKYIFVDAFSADSISDANSVRKESIEVNGCLGLDLCFSGGKAYIAYADKDGKLTVSKF